MLPMGNDFVVRVNYPSLDELFSEDEGDPPPDEFISNDAAFWLPAELPLVAVAAAAANC